MKIQLTILLITLAFVSFLQAQNRIQINIPTAESETEYIWQTLQDIPFFEQNNYTISLPQGKHIEKLKQKSKSSTLNDQDYKELAQFMRDSVYRATDYEKGYEKIDSQLVLINQMINQIQPTDYNWMFKTYPIYQINLTLYGPGGSYNPDEGSILIFTTPDGRFKSYDNPANTIIHEVVHIGIEASIIAKYDVPHPLKERIVDTFVSLTFGKDLPDYKVQNMGETRTDAYLKTVQDLKELDTTVENILMKK